MKTYLPYLIIFLFLASFSVYTVHAQGTGSTASSQNTGQTVGSQQTGQTVGSQQTGQTAPTQNVNVTIDNPFGNTGANTLYDLFTLLINKVVLPIGGVIAVVAFVYSGFLYVMAQGEEKKIQNAHRALLYTSIGTLILLGAWAILNVITGTVNQLIK